MVATGTSRALPPTDVALNRENFNDLEFRFDREMLLAEALPGGKSPSPVSGPTSNTAVSTTATPTSSTSLSSTVTSSGLTYDTSTLTNLQSSLSSIGFNRGIILQGGYATSPQGNNVQGLVAVSMPDFLIGVAGAVSDSSAEFAVRAEIPLHNSTSAEQRREATAPMNALGEAYDEIRDSIIATVTNTSYSPEQRAFNVAGLYTMTTSVTSQALDAVYGARGKITDEDQRRVSALLEGAGVLPLLQGALEMNNIEPSKVLKIAPYLYSTPSEIVSELADNLEE